MRITDCFIAEIDVYIFFSLAIIFENKIGRKVSVEGHRCPIKNLIKVICLKLEVRVRIIIIVININLVLGTVARLK